MSIAEIEFRIRVWEMCHSEVFENQISNWIKNGKKQFQSRYKFVPKPKTT